MVVVRRGSLATLRDLQSRMASSPPLWKACLASSPLVMGYNQALRATYARQHSLPMSTEAGRWVLVISCS